jgi:putative oxidoreductase
MYTGYTGAAGAELEISKGKNAVLWVLQVLGAAMLLMSGLMKLSGNEQMVQLFDASGGHWFRYVTGSIEIFSAVLLLFPPLSVVGALLLLPIIIGAIFAHLFIAGSSLALPIGVLIVIVLVAWGRWDRAFGSLR